MFGKVQATSSIHTALLDQFELERQGKYSRSIDDWGATFPI